MAIGFQGRFIELLSTNTGLNLPKKQLETGQTSTTEISNKSKIESLTVEEIFLQSMYGDNEAIYPKDISVESISDGNTNASYQVKANTGFYYMRIDDLNGSPVDFDTSMEKKLIRKCSDLGISPKYIRDVLVDGTPGFITELADKVGIADYTIQEDRLAVLSQFKKIHNLNVDYYSSHFSTEDKNKSWQDRYYFPIMDQMLESSGVLEQLPNEYLELLNKCRDDKLLFDESIQSYPCHGDGHPYNTILVSDGSIFLVDFEYASIMPIEYDLACAVTRSSLFEDENATIKEFAKSYNELPGEGPKVATDNLEKYIFLSNMHDVLWGALQVAKGKEEFVELRDEKIRKVMKYSEDIFN